MSDKYASRIVQERTMQGASASFVWAHLEDFQIIVAHDGSDAASVLFVATSRLKSGWMAVVTDKGLRKTTFGLA
jgi:hypothetical protein